MIVSSVQVNGCDTEGIAECSHSFTSFYTVTSSNFIETVTQEYFPQLCP